MITELVRQAQSGDAAAYTELVGKFQDAVFATAYQQVLDFEAARDLAQDTFIRAYERFSTLRDPDSFPGWVIRICRNLALNYVRRPEARWVSLDDLEPVTGDHTASIAAGDLAARALASLPEANRLALSLALVDGYTMPEIAALTGTSVTTVKGRIERAKRKLAEEVLPMLDETLKGNVPDDEFTLETVRKSLASARQALGRWDRPQAEQDALEALSGLQKVAEGTPGRSDLFPLSLQLLAGATVGGDRGRWREAMEDSISRAERYAETEQLAELLQLRSCDDDLPVGQRDASLAAAQQLYTGLGTAWRAAAALIARAQLRFERGEGRQGLQMLDRAREIVADVPYSSCDVRPALDTWLELAALLDLPAGAATLPGRLWGMHRWWVDGDHLRCGPYWGSARGWDDPAAAAFAPGFKLLWWTRQLRLPVEQWQAEEVLSTPGTRHPTTTRYWCEVEEAAVETAAGVFDRCRLLRASVSPHPDDGNAERMAGIVGEWFCWLARGVGAIQHRLEREDGAIEHTVLREFRGEQSDDWVPLAPGTQWVYEAAAPPPGVDTRVTFRMTGVEWRGVRHMIYASAGAVAAP